MAALLIVVAIGAVYLGTLGNPFVYDDHIWISWNPSIRHLWPIWSLFSPVPGSPVYGRPVLSLSLALNYALSGANPWSYHAANICIHTLAALTLFGIVSRTLAFLPERFPLERERTTLAFAAALIWAVHPLQTEAVTYVIQRAESLMGLFYLLALYSLARGVQGQHPRQWLLLCVLSCLLGMGVKQVMVTAPVVILAYDRTFAAGSFAGALRLRWRLYAALALTWLPLLGLGAGMRDPGVGFALGYTWWTYALTECWVVLHYILLALWPYPLVFDYGTDIVASVHATLPWLCILVMLVGASLVAFMRRNALGFAAVWFFAILAPSSSVVPVAFAPMAESRMYLPLAAVVTVLVVGAYWWLGRRSLRLVACAAVVLGIFANLRNRDYASEVSIWGDTVLRRPTNARARVALGSALALDGQDARAAEQFTEALRIDPGDFQARRNLGLALYHMGRLDEALACYRSIAPPIPDSAPLHYDIALALDGSGRTADAIAEYERAVSLDPGDGEARTNLGIALFRTGRVVEAVMQYGIALQALPGSARVHFNMGMALGRLGGVAKAIEQYREAVRLEPGYAEAHNNMGVLLAQTGREPEAIAEYEAALRIRPDYAMARANLEELKAGDSGRPVGR